jgi:hypothetical protein
VNEKERETIGIRKDVSKQNGINKKYRKIQGEHKVFP